jgi:hypothetical protein
MREPASSRAALAGRAGLPLAMVLCAVAAGCQGESPASPISATASARSDARREAAAPKPPPKPANQRRDETIAITFDDLQLDMKEDTVFRSSMLTDRVKQLDGQRVRIRGFIFPSIFQQNGITSFPLVKNTQCKFGPGGIAHHIIMIDLQPGLSTSYTVRPIAVEGVLTVRPWTGPDGNTWTIYYMVGEKVG